MIPPLLKLYLEKVNIFPSDNIVELVESESTFTIVRFVDVLIDLAYGPNYYDAALHEEAKNLINAIINSSICFDILRHLFVLQSPDKEVSGSKPVPAWKLKELDNLIRIISSKNEGIRHLMVTLCDLMGQDRSPKVAFQIAKCICRPPLNNNDDHYKQLSAQIIDLLQISNISKIRRMSNSDKYEHTDYLRFSHCVALECVHLIARINTQYTQKYILDILLADFYRITDSELLENIDESEMIILQSNTLMDSLNLHCALLHTLTPSSYIQSVIQSFSSIYITIASLISNKDNQFTSVATQIISRLITLLYDANGDTLSYLKSLVDLDAGEVGRRLNARVTIRSSLCRENIEVAWRDSFVHEEPMRASEELNATLLVILHTLPDSKKNDIVSTLFLWLLECRFNDDRKNDVIIPGKDEREISIASFRVHLLSLLCIEMESHCFTKSTDVLKLAQLVISRYCDGTEDSRNEVLNERLNFALSMVVSILGLGKLRDNDKPIFDQMFPMLQALRDTHPIEKTRDLITDICIIIATRGHANYLSKLPLCEDMDDSIDEELQEALNDVNSEETYLKGHGLVVIHRLLAARNESALRLRNRIYSILSHLLFHNESFVYLRAIGALSVIGDQYTGKMLPMIAQRLRALRSKHSLIRDNGADQSWIEEWLKLSEVFTKMISNLGITSPMYRDTVLSILMNGLRDEDEVIRSSSLSSLSELCGQHDYVMSSVIYEVVNSVCDMLVHDNGVLVKNAASLVIRRILLGTNDQPRPDIMHLFPGDVLRTIYHSLKTVLSTATDESIIDHASAAYYCLDESMKLFAFPKTRRL